MPEGIGSEWMGVHPGLLHHLASQFEKARGQVDEALSVADSASLGSDLPHAIGGLIGELVSQLATTSTTIDGIATDMAQYAIEIKAWLNMISPGDVPPEFFLPPEAELGSDDEGNPQWTIPLVPKPSTLGTIGEGAGTVSTFLGGVSFGTGVLAVLNAENPPVAAGLIGVSGAANAGSVVSGTVSAGAHLADGNFVDAAKAAGGVVISVSGFGIAKQVTKGITGAAGDEAATAIGVAAGAAGLGYSLGGAGGDDFEPSDLIQPEVEAPDGIFETVMWWEGATAQGIPPGLPESYEAGLLSPTAVTMVIDGVVVPVYPPPGFVIPELVLG